jgi:hypothetical protein
MTANSYICPPPLVKLIPVTLGCDRSFTVQRVNSSGTPVNFDAGTTSYIFIDISRENPTRVNAVISGSTAAFTISSTVCDLVKTGTRWRIVLDFGELESPLLVGRFERHDG